MRSVIVRIPVRRKFRPDTRNIRLVVEEVVGVITVIFDAVQLEHPHPLHQTFIGYGTLRFLCPVPGL
ncbi:Uncharacterised protein [Enterobacter cloacae]|nr:Uncharacterised protein [Enterobacter cloacae]